MWVISGVVSIITDGDSGDCAGNGAVLDVQVDGADAGEGHADDGVAVALQGGLGLFLQGKVVVGDVGVLHLCKQILNQQKQPASNPCLQVNFTCSLDCRWS